MRVTAFDLLSSVLSYVRYRLTNYTSLQNNCVYYNYTIKSHPKRNIFICHDFEEYLDKFTILSFRNSVY